MEREHSIVREGLIAGAAGATAVALWFFLLDLAQGRLFFTPGALGSIFFLDANRAEQVQITATTVLGYSLIHVLIFFGLGFAAARIFNWADEEPRVLIGLGVLLVTMEIFAIGLISIAANWLLDELSLWGVLAGTLIGLLAIGFYLWRVHPRARRDMRDTGLEEIDVNRADVQRGPPPS